MARPREHDRVAVVTAICAAISTGVLVKDAVKKHGIHRDTLHAWLTEDAALSDRYARARESQADAVADEAMVIADSPAATSEAVARNRLRVDTRKWLAAKLAPRRYGEKLEVGGPEGGPLIVRVVRE